MKIDLQTGDLVFPIQMVSGADAVAQAILIRLRFFAGTWALDTSAGTPYFQDVLGKQPGGQAGADAVIKAQISGTPGFLSLLSFSSQIDARKYSCTFSCDTEYGPTGEITWPA